MKIIKSFKLCLVLCMLLSIALLTFPKSSSGVGLKSELSMFFATEKGALITEAISSNYNYQTELRDPQTKELIANPQTKIKFAVDRVIEFLKGNYKAYKMNIAAKAARAKSISEAQTELEGL